MTQDWLNSLRRRNRSRSKKHNRLFWIILVVVVVGGVAALIFYSRSAKLAAYDNDMESAETLGDTTSTIDRSKILDLWQKGDKDNTLALCREGVAASPLDPFYLSFEGIAAYYSSLEKPEGDERQALLDEAVFSLRKSLVADEHLPIRAQVEYVLGKSYFQKGTPWYDLAISFLELSKKDGYSAVDTEQYLGLAYAGMGLHDKAIEHYELALSQQPSDVLMLSAAMSYKEVGNSTKAEELLTKVIDSNVDAILVQKSRYMLADFAMEKGDLTKASSLYQAIVNADPQAADAWFQMGLIYEKQNDPIKARAAWRKVISINPNYAEARKKLAEKL